MGLRILCIVTLKALANGAQQPSGTPSEFVSRIKIKSSQGCSNPGLELGNAFSVVRRHSSFRTEAGWLAYSVETNS